MISRKPGAHAKHIRVGDLVIGAGLSPELEPLWPFHFNRRHGEEEGAGELAGLAQPRLRNGFFSGEFGKGFSQRRVG